MGSLDKYLKQRGQVKILAGVFKNSIAFIITAVQSRNERNESPDRRKEGDSPRRGSVPRAIYASGRETKLSVKIEGIGAPARGAKKRPRRAVQSACRTSKRPDRKRVHEVSNANRAVQIWVPTFLTHKRVRVRARRASNLFIFDAS